MSFLSILGKIVETSSLTMTEVKNKLPPYKWGKYLVRRNFHGIKSYQILTWTGNHWVFNKDDNLDDPVEAWCEIKDDSFSENV